MNDWLGVKKDELVHFIADEKHLKEVEAIKRWALSTDSILKTTILPSNLIQNGEKIEQLSKILAKEDIIIGATSYSFITTKAVANAVANGARFLSLPLSTNDNSSLLENDFIKMSTSEAKKMADIILKKMKNSKQIRVTTSLGTDLTLSIKDRKASSFTGKIKKKQKGSASFEVYVAPQEDSCNGTLYLDGSYGYIGLVKSPIKIEFKKGKLISATSKDSGANKLLDYIKSFKDELMFKPGEFGIGLNKKAKCRGICYIEDESTYGTFHIGMGRNLSLGGKQAAKGHFDIVTHKPTIYADNKLIMKNGVIVKK